MGALIVTAVLAVMRDKATKNDKIVLFPSLLVTLTGIGGFILLMAGAAATSLMDAKLFVRQAPYYGAGVIPLGLLLLRSINWRIELCQDGFIFRNWIRKEARYAYGNVESCILICSMAFVKIKVGGKTILFSEKTIGASTLIRRIRAEKIRSE